VSGFNVEYSGPLFSFIFICEYGMVVLIGVLSTCFFLGSSDYYLKVAFLCFLFV